MNLANSMLPTKRDRPNRSDMRFICIYRCKYSDGTFKELKYKSLKPHYHQCHKTTYDANEIPYYSTSDPNTLRYGPYATTTAPRKKPKISITKAARKATQYPNTTPSTLQKSIIIPPLPSPPKTAQIQSPALESKSPSPNATNSENDTCLVDKLKQVGFDMLGFAQLIVKGIKDTVTL